MIEHREQRSLADQGRHLCGSPGDWAKQGEIVRIKKQSIEMKRICCFYYVKAHPAI